MFFYVILGMQTARENFNEKIYRSSAFAFALTPKMAPAANPVVTELFHHLNLLNEEVSQYELMLANSAPYT